MSTACWAVCGVVVERRLHNGRSPTSRGPFRWVGATIFSGPGWARCGVVVERRLHNGPEEVCTAPAAARCGTMCAGRLCTSCGHEANDQFQEQTAGNASHNLGADIGPHRVAQGAHAPSNAVWATGSRRSMNVVPQQLHNGPQPGPAFRSLHPSFRLWAERSTTAPQPGRANDVHNGPTRRGAPGLNVVRVVQRTTAKIARCGMSGPDGAG